MTTMIEKVADSIFDVIWPTQDWDETACRALSPVAARAAIAAMREPTASMKTAVREIAGVQALAYALAAWPTMIDAALEEKAQ